jgi:8-oxo-dGTP pyrophosphatase MutT (NUDIX family)
VQPDNPWQTLSSKRVYENAWIEVTEHDVINPSGRPGIYGTVHFKHLAIGILPLDDEGNIWLVGQYRFPLKAYSWEIPEGGGHLDVEPLESARRELKEETGIEASRWQKLLELHLSNSVSDEHAFIFLATGLSFGEAMPEETEALTVRKLPFEEVYAMALDGRITDAIAVAGILRLKLLLAESAL